MEESYSIMVNKDHEFQLTQEDIAQLDILRTAENSFHILRNGQAGPPFKC